MSRIRVAFLTKINAILVALTTFFGCNNSGISINNNENLLCKYGCPYSDLSVQGTVKDEADKPLEKIQISVKMVNNGPFEAVTTDAEGHYNTGNIKPFPADSVKVVATDPTGQYVSDSTKVPSNYTGAEGWYGGKAEVHVDFVLTKAEK